VVGSLVGGIDVAAHAGALEGGQPTVAVLAHGLERALPRSTAALAQRVLDQAGAWVSEHPYGTPARDEHQVLRNRIQVGLAAGTVVVEGASQSAARSHADLCLRERRALFAVVPKGIPMQLQLPRSLVEQGAQAIGSRDDYAALLAALTASADTLTASTAGSARAGSPHR
jgi:DNA processing protein